MSQIGRHALSRFLTLSRPFFHSELRWKAFLLLGLLVALVFALTGLNAVNSYVFTGRFMTALQKQAAPEFWFYGLLSVGIFGLLTLAGVSKTFIEQRFALLWRWWLTRHLTDRYLANHAYYHLNQGGAIDNPDQRIAEDVRTFTETSLSLGLILFNAALTLFSFSGILWSITPWLLLVALGYAAVGSFLTLLVGGRLVRMNVFRLKQEADLRCASSTFAKMPSRSLCSTEKRPKTLRCVARGNSGGQSPLDHRCQSQPGFLHHCLQIPDSSDPGPHRGPAVHRGEGRVRCSDSGGHGLRFRSGRFLGHRQRVSAPQRLCCRHRAPWLPVGGH